MRFLAMIAVAAAVFFYACTFPSAQIFRPVLTRGPRDARRAAVRAGPDEPLPVLADPVDVGVREAGASTPSGSALSCRRDRVPCRLPGILSTPEGADKPSKYPLMFQESSALVINKIDLAPYVDVDVSKIRKDALSLNPGLKMFEISCRTGEGLDAWVQWLRETAGKHRLS